MRFSKSKADHTGRTEPTLQQSMAETVSLAGQYMEKPEDPSDWKKILLITGLGTLSWISTYTGMLELIQANMGEISLIYKGAIAFAVAMLMLMIIWLLDSLFSRLSIPVRVLFTCGYIFLTVISIGFGFGFYWKFLESRGEASRSAESAVTQVNSALLSAQTRMEQLQTTLVNLTSLSQQKAIEEREKGNSCPNSRPGDGPRRRLRDADAKNFQYAGNFVSQRVGGVKKDITVLAAELQLVAKRHKSTIDPKTGTRNIYLRGLNQKLNNSVTRFNAFRTDPQLNQFRNIFAERASQTIFPDGNGGKFTCPDPQLQAALRGVVAAIDQLPELEKPQVAAVEGSEAIIEAFRRLTVTMFGALTLKMPPTPEELRSMQQTAVQSVGNVALQRQVNARQAGLGNRDYIPLAIAVFVDFCLLLVSMTRPMHGFRSLERKMFEAQEWPIIQILARFRDIHSDEDIRQTFDIFRHVVFDYMGDYYVGVPLKAPANAEDREDAQLEAHLLSNLFTSFEKEGIFKRVVWPNSAIARKRLERQDSKFTGSDAFRIYRFKDGAWSDWVLGAIMGAAKRVEAEKARQRMEKQIFPNREQELKDAPADAIRAAEDIIPAEHGLDRPDRPDRHDRKLDPRLDLSSPAGPDFDQTGYTNVEAFPKSHAKSHANQKNNGHGARPEDQSKSGAFDLENDLRANGTDHGFEHAAGRQTTAQTEQLNGGDTNGHSFTNGNSSGDVIHLSDAGAELARTDTRLESHDGPGHSAEHKGNGTSLDQSNGHPASDGTIRLKRETVEFDQGAVNALNSSQNGNDFMSALTSALNVPQEENNEEQAAIEHIQTEEMPLLDDRATDNNGQTLMTSPDTYLHESGHDSGHETGADEVPGPGPETVADDKGIDQFFPHGIEMEEQPVSGYADEWEDQEFQIDNITRWYGKKDPDSKSG